MTNERVSGFASELVQMATAAAKLPELEGQVESLLIQTESLRNTIQRLEMKAMDRNAEIIDLNASIRKLEVERDNAETMFLEADDKASAWRRLVGSFQADAKALLEAQEPQPIVEPAPVVDPTPVPVPQIGTGTDASQSGTEGQSPFVSTADPVPSRSDATLGIAEGGQREAAPTIASVWDPILGAAKGSGEGQSEANPTAVGIHTDQQANVHLGSVASQDTVASSEVSVQTDPTQAGPTGLSPVGTKTEEQSSGTSPSQGSTSETEAKPISEHWEIFSRASHNS